MPKGKREVAASHVGVKTIGNEEVLIYEVIYGRGMGREVKKN